MTDIFKVTFGTIGGAAPHDIAGTATTITLQGGGAAVTPLQWQNVQTETNLVDGIGDEKSDTSMDALGIWSFGFCGNDGVNNPNVNEQVSKNVESWQVVLPVGGEILQLDSAALMIAGLSTGMIWLAPVVLGGAAAAFGVYRLRK